MAAVPGDFEIGAACRKSTRRRTFRAYPIREKSRKRPKVLYHPFAALRFRGSLTNGQRERFFLVTFVGRSSAFALANDTRTDRAASLQRCARR